MSEVYTTGNLICSQCGRFLQPELVRDKSEIPTGVLNVRGHNPGCPLFGTSLAPLVFRREEEFVLIQIPNRLPGGAELPIGTRRLFQEAVQVRPRSPRIEVRSRLASSANVQNY